MIDIRRVFTHVEEIYHEFGPAPAIPLRRGAAVAVIRNPFAGRFEADIAPFMDELKPLGLDLAHRLITALGSSASAIQGYGKAAIVGAAGELEHGALWHVPGGYGMREALGWKAHATESDTTKHYAARIGTAKQDTARIDTAKNAAAKNESGKIDTAMMDGTRGVAAQPANALAIVPSTKKVGAPGTTIDVPLTHINASYVRSHLDAIEIRVPGAPAADETAYILVMSLGPRIHERLGGLRVEQIERWDGQR